MFMYCVGFDFSLKTAMAKQQPDNCISPISGNGYPAVLYSASFYSELNLNQYSVVSLCRTICTVCGSSPCPDFC
ncbi:hypothetical protein EIKCOROL_00814 [Eikenella corrodens ATCC 23834]|uniref:Uncharacterized protein n=1 Tax=Eikenella corrodens ATCC 23834 TaxID=546274 RepID=C0DTY3_EIKCO|nr:hypothetical protein EIKCOROL_00814 [Eikenella corrodens ATCC 23834]